MFGYIVANTSTLSQEDLAIYKSYYCGLCSCIGKDFGSLQRAALNYDMTFLTLLLSSLYEPQEDHNTCRCAVHPIKRHMQTVTDATHYAAAMNIALAYYNCMDDWHDDKKLKAFALTKVFEKNMPIISERYPNKCSAITTCLDKLADAELHNVQEPDVGANIFGALLGEVFAWKEDRWSSDLRLMGTALGRFIYLMDAIVDLPKDVKKKNYNPLRSRWSSKFDKADYAPVLKIMLGECTDAFERLPIINHINLLRNILYSGVWTKFYHSDLRVLKEDSHV